MVPRLLTRTLLCVLFLGCGESVDFDVNAVGKGPGQYVGNGGPVTDGLFAGGDDALPAARAVAPPADDSRPPDCDLDCRNYCAGAALQNPVNVGLCHSLWGVGMASKPIVPEEACRRLYVDLQGRYLSADELPGACAGGYGATVKRLIDDPAFVFINQRRMADRFLYANEVVNVEAVYDMDQLVSKLYRGLVPYDLFGAVASAHPVLVRRFADSRDRAESLFTQFLGRPPFENERADMGRLYNLWSQGYYDHRAFGLRLPDAFVRYECLNDKGQPDEDRRGECASTLWGYEELILQPDVRASQDRDGRERKLTMWQGLLTPAEWSKMQLPGRILARNIAFWEKAVEDVLVQYLGYNLAAQVPEVREELVKWVLRYNGDIRSVHYAVATSAAYLQSSAGDSAKGYRWTYGPLKQLDAEVWIDSLARLGGRTLSSCDHRIAQPEQLIDSGSLFGYRLIDASRWDFKKDGELDTHISELARTLGGCPSNIVGGRFKVVSILTTATQTNFVNELCSPDLNAREGRAPVEKLLPAGVSSGQPTEAELAQRILSHQLRAFYGRAPTADEQTDVATAATECAASGCNAEAFARPLCFALLSSAEMIFY